VPEIAKHPAVTYLVNLGDEDLSSLYSHALAFVTFSEKEGFGLPLVEALACGTPVLFSGGGAIGEIVGTAGIKIEEKDLQEVLHSINTSPGRLQELKAQAFKRSRLFSWQACAQQTLELYKSLRALRARG
jgi:glycosyltransferase involved in cell wall biosynthesis